MDFDYKKKQSILLDADMIYLISSIHHINFP